jgi:class 3 adenylate cyclase/tetratricopeptide (TPR) repeat protein
MQNNNKTMKEERRLVAIMFTDIQGSCKLMEHDEQATIRMIGEQNELISRLTEKWSGRVAKSTGDGVMVEFASAVNAVRCGIEIQEEIREYNRSKEKSRKLPVRIGIHLGDIVIKEDDIYGEGVNLAARLEPLAKPGEICISRTVYEQVKRKMPAQIKELGRKRLKNIEEPVQVYAVVPWKTGEKSPTEERSLRVLPARRVGRIVVIAASVITVAAAISTLSVIARKRVAARSIAVMPFDYKSDQIGPEGLLSFILTGYLEERNDIRVLQEGRKQEVLRILGRDESALRDLSVARELCQRAGINTMVTGRISQENGVFKVSASIRSVGSLDVVDSVTAVKESGDDVLKTIESLARSVAVGIHPSLTRTIEQNNGEFRFSRSLEANRHFMEARKSLRTHSFEAAKLSLEMATEADSTFALAYAYLACMTLENEELVEKALRHKKSAGEKDQLYIMARVATARDDTDESLKAYKKIVTLYPKDEEAHCRLGRCWEKKRMFSEAIDQCEQAIRLNPAYAEAYRRSGHIYRATGNFSKAIECYVKYRELSEHDDPRAYMTFVELYRCSGDYEKAIQEFKAAQKKHPSSEALRLGKIYVEIGRYDEAIKCFQQYISSQSLSPLVAIGHKDLAFVCLAKREHDRTILEAETSLSYYPEYPPAIWIMGIAYARKGEYERARQEAERLSELDQDLYHNHLMGEISFERSAFDEAVGFFSQAVSLCPTEAKPFFVNAMAKAYFRKGDLNRAVREYEQVFEQNPNHAHSRLALAQAYSEKGLMDAAVEEYRKFLEIWKDADYDLPELGEAREAIQDFEERNGSERSL